MMSTDGVGTKAEIARRSDRLDGLGWDLVAMCIDDLVATGARPIAMTDYLAVGSVDVPRIERLVRSIAAACEEAGVALLGGETAEHPGVMEPDAFDLAGAALGVVEDGAQIDGSAIRLGDVVVGVHSPNLRSNGFSLVRSVVLAGRFGDGPALGDGLALDDPMPGEEGSVAEVLLDPSVLYTPAVLRLIETVPVSGMAHITGGGLVGNIPRVLPATCDAAVFTDTWLPPAVFTTIQQMGNVPGADMFRTFNMGIGFVVIVPPDHAAATLAALTDSARPATVIGEITPGTGTVRLT
jgi:phosphoribosylformylglycinamidine cyclo-ligase